MNSCLFAGEQFDENLSHYYLRQRYYDAESSRFTRRDTYEGRLTEPITLHKYLYGHTNPINLVDPSGLTPTRFGQAVHDEIGSDFVTLNPTDHLYDNTIAQILTRRTGGYTVGIRGNGRRPDLAEIGFQEVYEIKPSNSREIRSGVNRLILYQALLNAQDPGWSGGMTYVPPGLITIPQDPNAIYLITPPMGGLILYTRVDLKTTSNALKLTVITTMAAMVAYILSQMIVGGPARAFI